MVDLINGTNEEKMKYYYALGMAFGKAISRKGGLLQTRYEKYIRGLNDNMYPDTRTRLNELVELLIIAEVHIPHIDSLYSMSDVEKNKAIHSILNFAMKPIAKNNN